MIAEKLGVSVDGLPETVTLKYLRKSKNGVLGRTRGTTMWCDQSTLLGTTGDGAALLVHELTHVVQGYSLSTFRRHKWIAEGIADCMRSQLFPDSPWAIREKATFEIGIRMTNSNYSFRQGYFPAASLLIFIQDRIDPEILVTVDQALKSHKYRDSFFKERTSKTLDQLWAEFVRHHSTKSASPPGARAHRSTRLPPWTSRGRAAESGGSGTSIFLSGRPDQ